MSILVKCEADNPRRCKACDTIPYLAVEGSDFCQRHGANSQLVQKENKSKGMYQLAKWRSKINEFTSAPEQKGLTEEVAILRMTLEATLLRCEDAESLFMFSAKISDLVVKIEKLITAMHRMDTASGKMLDRTAALQFASTVVEIVDSVIREWVTDEDLADKVSQLIGDGIMTALTNMETAKPA